MKTMWAPWRLDFILGAKAADCFMCEAPKLGVAPESLVLAITRHSFVILNRYPYNNGHLLVCPKRHVATPGFLTPEEQADLHTLLVKSIEITRSFKPHGVNVGMNLGEAAGAGCADHIHYHIVPRWVGDTNAMTVVGDTRVIPESLDAAWNRLAPLYKTEE